MKKPNNNILLQKIGANAKYYRKEKNILVKDIAERAGYTAGNITRFEQGKINSIPILFAYLNSGIQIYELFEGVSIND